MQKNFYRQVVKLPPNSVTAVDFNGLTPNYYRVINSGSTRIYAGIISHPSARLYDFEIGPHQTRMHCTDKGYPKMFIYNPSGSDVTVIVVSFNAPFSPEVLAFCDFNIAENEDQTVNVEIGGFTDSLPTGQNHIGKVTVSDHPAALMQLLTAIENKIGQTTLEGDVSVDMTSTNAILSEINTKTVPTDLTNVNSLLTQILNKQTSVDMSATNEILTDILNKPAGGGEVETHLFSHNGNISYGEYWSRDLNVKEVVYFANDGEADIMLTLFDQGEAVTMTLKAGEVINHITGNFTSIGVDTSTHSVTIPYRLVFKYV